MIVILGSNGQLGTAFSKLVPDATPLPKEILDLSDPVGLLDALHALKPSVIINAAAWTDVDRAEIDPEGAEAINTTAPATIARYTNASGGRLLTFSTDYVFDGTASGPYDEASETCPINVYGETKLRGEELVLSTDPRALIIRTSLLISTTHVNFLTAMLERALLGTVRATTDQVCSPTFVPDLATAVLPHLRSDLAGIVHMTNDGECSRFELLQTALSVVGLDENVEPAVHTDFPSRTRRPAHSTLVSSIVDSGMPHWTDSLGPVADQILQRIKAADGSTEHR